MAGSGVALGADPRAARPGHPDGRRSDAMSSARSSGPLVFLLLFILLWEYFHRDGMRRFFDKPGFLLPSLATVFDQGFLDSVVRQQYITGIAWTTFAAVIGLSISIVLEHRVVVRPRRPATSWSRRSSGPTTPATSAARACRPPAGTAASGVSGVDGGQGEAVRVPQAQGTLVKLPVGEDSALLPSLLTLSDVFPHRPPLRRDRRGRPAHYGDGDR